MPRRWHGAVEDATGAHGAHGAHGAYGPRARVADLAATRTPSPQNPGLGHLFWARLGEWGDE